MAEIRGMLRVIGNESRVNAVLQAICGDPVDPIAAGTNFLAGLGFVDGDELVVSGSPAAIGNVPVFCVHNASRVAAAAAVMIDAAIGMPETGRTGRAAKKAKAARPRRKGAARKKTGTKGATKAGARKAPGTRARKRRANNATRKSARESGGRKSTRTRRKGR